MYKTLLCAVSYPYLFDDFQPLHRRDGGGAVSELVEKADEDTDIYRRMFLQDAAIARELEGAFGGQRLFCAWRNLIRILMKRGNSFQPIENFARSLQARLPHSRRELLHDARRRLNERAVRQKILRELVRFADTYLAELSEMKRQHSVNRALCVYLDALKKVVRAGLASAVMWKV